MSDFLSRQPFSILGAIGILSIVSNIGDIPDQIATVIEVWQHAARPITDFVFGRIIEFLGLNLTDFWNDYLKMSVICAGAFLRARKSFRRNLFRQFETDVSKTEYFINATIITVFQGLFWPIIVAANIYSYLTGFSNDSIFWTKESTSVYFESFIYVLILLGINFAIMQAQ